jgi:hypothetical protein
VQSGQAERSAASALDQAGNRLNVIAARAAVSGADVGSAKRERPELAFYGGTFTSLADNEFRACLDFVRNRLDCGHISTARCSTRPDRLDRMRLAAMREAGFSLVELGVQSFQDRALEEAGRGYSGAAASAACAAVGEAGFALGIQLMPGMPGLDRAGAERDVRLALAAAPDCVRLYPCLVLEDTELADMWRAGRYRPWETEETTDFLAWALGMFHAAGIPVIRIGVTEEEGLSARVLAGPRHPALGNRVRALALYHYLRDILGRIAPDAGRPGHAGIENARTAQARGAAARPGGAGESAFRRQAPREVSQNQNASAAPEYFLRVPDSLQGDFWGHGGELEDRYAALGLTKANVCRWGESDFALLRIMESAYRKS